jgi:hypothetical protein
MSLIPSCKAALFVPLLIAAQAVSADETHLVSDIEMCEAGSNPFAVYADTEADPALSDGSWIAPFANLQDAVDAMTQDPRLDQLCLHGEFHETVFTPSRYQGVLKVTGYRASPLGYSHPVGASLVLQDGDVGISVDPSLSEVRVANLGIRSETTDLESRNGYFIGIFFLEASPQPTAHSLKTDLVEIELVGTEAIGISVGRPYGPFGTLSTPRTPGLSGLNSSVPIQTAITPARPNPLAETNPFKAEMVRTRIEVAGAPGSSSIGIYAVGLAELKTQGGRLGLLSRPTEIENHCIGPSSNSSGITSANTSLIQTTDTRILSDSECPQGILSQNRGVQSFVHFLDRTEIRGGMVGARIESSEITPTQDGSGAILEVEASGTKFIGQRGVGLSLSGMDLLKVERTGFESLGRITDSTAIRIEAPESYWSWKFHDSQSPSILISQSLFHGYHFGQAIDIVQPEILPHPGLVAPGSMLFVNNTVRGADTVFRHGTALDLTWLTVANSIFDQVDVVFDEWSWAHAQYGHNLYHLNAGGEFFRSTRWKAIGSITSYAQWRALSPALPSHFFGQDVIGRAPEFASTITTVPIDDPRAGRLSSRLSPAVDAGTDFYCKSYRPASGATAASITHRSFFTPLCLDYNGIDRRSGNHGRFDIGAVEY